MDHFNDDLEGDDDNKRDNVVSKLASLIENYNKAISTHGKAVELIVES